MAKIFLCSDLHTNFHKDGGKSVIKSFIKDVDIIAVAGDLSIITNGLLQENIRMLCEEYPEVVYVSGNHEYYHSSFSSIDSILNNLESELDNFTWLNNTKKEVGGVDFIGCTLWFPNSTAAQINKGFLNDYRCISGFEPAVYDRNEYSINYLESNIKEGDVVLTHHMPSYKCVHKKFAKSRFNCFFACRLDALISRTKPSVWMYGHTHFNGDMMIGDTKVVANPFGYPGENPFFKDDLVIEV